MILLEQDWLLYLFPPYFTLSICVVVFRKKSSFENFFLRSIIKLVWKFLFRHFCRRSLSVQSQNYLCSFRSFYQLLKSLLSAKLVYVLTNLCTHSSLVLESHIYFQRDAILTDLTSIIGNHGNQNLFRVYSGLLRCFEFSAFIIMYISTTLLGLRAYAMCRC